MKRLLTVCMACFLLIASACNHPEEMPMTSLAENPTSQTTASLPTTTRGPEPTLPIPEDAPREYVPVLEELQRLIENSGQYADESGNPIAYKYPLGGEWGIYDWSLSIVGYVIKDINNDGIPELIIMTSDYFITAIFTLSKGKPVQLGAYEKRFSCIFGEDGKIYTFRHGGAMNSCEQEWILPPKATQLKLLSEFGVRSTHDPDSSPHEFYKIINGKDSVITEEECRRLGEQQPAIYVDSEEFTRSFTNHLGLEFIPLGVRAPRTD